MRAADLFVQALENEDVEFVFGVPGEENLDVLESLRLLLKGEGFRISSPSSDIAWIASTPSSSADTRLARSRVTAPSIERRTPLSSSTTWPERRPVIATTVRDASDLDSDRPKVGKSR